MPSNGQCQELFDYCTTEWTTVNGVNGMVFTGSNGGSIFLPTTGYRWDKFHPYYVGSLGDYWSSTQHPSNSYCYDMRHRFSWLPS